MQASQLMTEDSEDLTQSLLPRPVAEVSRVSFELYLV